MENTTIATPSLLSHEGRNAEQINSTVCRNRLLVPELLPERSRRASRRTTFNSQLLIDSYIGGGVQPGFNAVGRKRNFRPLSVVEGKGNEMHCNAASANAQPAKALSIIHYPLSIVHCALLIVFCCLFFGNTAFAQSPYSWGSSSDYSGNSNHANPFGRFYGYEYRIYLYPPNTLPFSGNITQIEFLPYATMSSNGGQMTVWMKTVTDITELSSSTTFATYKSGATQVYNTNSSPSYTAGSYVSIPLSTPIAYNNTNNEYLMILVRSVANGSSGDGGTSFYYKNPSNASNNTWYAKNDGSDPGESGTNWGSKSTGAYLPVIRVTYCPTTISSRSDWNAFCDCVNNGHNYSGETVTMTADVGSTSTPVTKMAGTINGSNPDKCFAGTFEGNGHTVTINVSGNNNRYAAPFRCVDGATIRNVRTAGTISGNTTDGKILAGVVGRANGTTSVIGCSSSATITTSKGDDACLCGIVASYGGTLTVEGCAFTGSLTGGTANTRNGGLVGYRYSGSCVVKNSIFAPSSLNVSSETDYSFTIARTTNSANPTITNCYYTQVLGNAQGKKAYTITGASPVTVDMSGNSTSYTGSGITAYAQGIKYGGYIYGGSGDNLSLSLSGSSTGYTADHGTLSGSSDPYTLAMEASNTQISASQASAVWMETTTIIPGEDYLIGFSYDGNVYLAVNYATNETNHYYISANGATYYGYTALAVFDGNYVTGCSGYATDLQYCTWKFSTAAGGTIQSGSNENYYLVTYSTTGYEDLYPYNSTSNGTDWTYSNGSLYRAVSGTDRYAQYYGGITGDHMHVSSTSSATVKLYTKQIPTYTLTLIADPTAGGNVSASPSGPYHYGDEVTITATANTGYTFSSWSDGGAASHTVTITGNATYTANFTHNTYTLTLNANPAAGGNVSASPSGPYHYGDVVTITATANNGYTFSSWSDGGADSHTVTITGNATYTANFTQNTYTLTLNANPTAGGNVSASPSGPYHYGDVVTITATPNTGYTFVNWTENGTQVSTNASYNFTVTDNRTLVANFEAISSGEEECNIIGDEDENKKGYTYGPVNDYYNYGYYQIIYPKAYVPTGNIISIWFDFAYSTAMTDKNDVTIYMGTTSENTLSAWKDLSTMTKVREGDLNCTQHGWNEFTLDTPYSFDGTENLVVVIMDKSGDYDSYDHKFYYATSEYNVNKYVYCDGSGSGYITFPTNDSGTPSIGSSISNSNQGNVAHYPIAQFCAESSCSNFENNSSNANVWLNGGGSLPSGWNALISGDASWIPHLYNGEYAKDGTGIVMAAGLIPGNTNYLVMPVSDIFNNNRSVPITFNAWWQDINEGTLSVGYMTDPADGNTFVWVDDATPSPSNGGSSLTGQNTVVIPAGMPAGARVAFRWSYNTSWSVVVIDNICVGPPCNSIVFYDDFGGNNVQDDRYATPQWISANGYTSGGDRISSNFKHSSEYTRCNYNEYYVWSQTVDFGDCRLHGSAPCTDSYNGVYALNKNTYHDASGNGWVVNKSDHTFPNDVTRGYMLQGDGSGVVYQKVIDNVPADDYTFSAWFMNIYNTSTACSLTVRGTTVSGGSATISPTISTGQGVWNKQSLDFTLTAQGSITITISVGNGSNFAIDDILVALRTDAPPVASISLDFDCNNYPSVGVTSVIDGVLQTPTTTTNDTYTVTTTSAGVCDNVVFADARWGNYHIYYDYTLNCDGTSTYYVQDVPMSSCSPVSIRNEVPTCSGKCFIKWAERANGGGNNYQPGDPITLTSDVYLYAIYEIAIGQGRETDSEVPSNSGYKYSLTQQIYTPCEIGNAGDIGSISFYNAGTTVIRNFDIYLSHTTKDVFTDASWETVAAGYRVFSGNVTMTTGTWTTITFNTANAPFHYNGINNLLVTVNDKTNSANSGLDCRTTNVSKKAIYLRGNGSAYNPASPPSSGYAIDERNQVRFSLCNHQPLQDCEIVATATDGGTVSGAGTYTACSTVTLTATPAPCYRFVNWTEGNEVASTSATYTFRAAGNRNLVANFEQVAWSPSILSSPESLSCLNSGTPVTLTAGSTAPFNSYSFVAESGSFSPLGDDEGTSCNASYVDDNSYSVDLPFSFNYLGGIYDRAKLSTNGFLIFGSGSDSYTNDLASSSYYNNLAVFWDDLFGKIKYMTQGSAPNREFVMQLDGYVRDDGSTHTFLCQIRLHESSNIIEFCYGDGFASVLNSSASIGLNNRADGVTKFISVTPTGIGTAATSTETATDNLSETHCGYLTSGTIYRFKPNITYNWTPVGTAGTNSYNTYTVSPTELYNNYTVNVTANGCTKSASKVVSIMPTAPTDISGTTTICNGESTTLTATGGTSVKGSGIIWTKGNSCPASSPVIFAEGFDQNGLYPLYNCTYSCTNSVARITTGNEEAACCPGTADPQVYMFNIGEFPYPTYRYMYVKYRVPSESADADYIQIFYKDSRNLALDEPQSAHSSSLVNDGKWHIAKIDLNTCSDRPRDYITGWRFDYANPVGVQMDVDYIILSSSDYEILSSSETLPDIESVGSTFVTPNLTENTTYQAFRSSMCGKTGCKSATVTVNIPSVTLPDLSDQNQTICEGGTINQLDVTPTSYSGSLSYQWAWNGSNIDNSNHQTCTPTQAGTYTVTVTASHGGECIADATESAQLVINPNPSVTLTATPSSVCLGDDILLEATGGGAGVTYNWGDGNDFVGTTTHTVTPESTDIHAYQILAGNANCTAMYQAEVEVKPRPTPSINGGDTPICSGSGNTTLTANGGPGSGTPYHWNTGASTQAITVSPTSNTEYIVTVTGANGCEATASKVVKVPSEVALSVSSTTNCIAPRTSRTLTASGGGIEPFAFSARKGIFESISGTEVGFYDEDDDYVSVPIGFTFSYNGVDRTSVYASTNGFLQFGEDGDDDTDNDLFSDYLYNLLAPYWDDTKAVSTVDALYSVIGTSPNRVFVYEYYGYPYYNYSSSTIRYQVKLYEGSNIIEFCYGADFPANSSSSTSASIGLNYRVGSVTKFVSVTPTGDGTATTSTATANDNIGTAQCDYITDGTIYRFTPIDASNPTYSWSYTGTEGIANNENMTYTVSPVELSNTYTVSASSNGCNSESNVITITTKPTLTTSVSPSPAVVCQGETVQLTATTNASGITWSNGLGTSSQVEVSPDYTTTYTVTATSPASCMSNANVVATIKPLPVITASPDPAATCLNGSTQVVMSASDVSASPSFAWSYTGTNGGASTTTYTNDTYTVTPAASTSTYTVTNTETGCSRTETINILSPSNITVTGDGSVDTNCGVPLELSANYDSETEIYGWYSDEACTSSVSSTNTYSVTSDINTANPTYYVKVTDRDSLVASFQYTGDVQTFTIPEGTDHIKLEVWGAEGGGRRVSNNSNHGLGGKGGYSVGTMPVSGGETLNVYVGGIGGYSSSGQAIGGWNGGGTTYASSESEPAGGGGGATDIRLNGTSLYNRIIVAGGGGGGGEDSSDQGGYGGGTSGGPGSYSYQGTQTSAGTGGVFGIGASSTYDGGAGGGGWYGGGCNGGSQTIPTSNSNSDCSGGSGGSGYVWTSATASSAPSGYNVSSSYYLTDAQTIAGNTSMPNPNGGTMIGREGDGFARITCYSTTGYCSAKRSVEVTINKPSVSITDLESNAVCEGSSHTFNTNAAIGTTGFGELGYQWTHNGSSVSGNASCAASVAGTYSVTVSSVYGNCTASATSEASLTVNVPNDMANANYYNFIWKGGTASHETDWNTPTNWYINNSGTYSVASGTTLPTTSDNVYVGTSQCASNTESQLSNTASANNITIASGTLTIPDGKTLRVAGTVTGTLTASDGSTVEFCGGGNQSLSAEASFYNVTFAQTGDAVHTVTANNGITVRNSATFTKGIVDGNVTFGSSATATGAKIASHVDGKVTKQAGGSAFTFPTGNAGVLGTITASVTSDTWVRFHNVSATPSLLPADYPRYWNVADNCDGNDPQFDHVSNFEYWDISTGGLANASVTVSATTENAHFGSVDPEPVGSDIYGAIWQGCWKNLGGSGEVSDENRTITVGGVSIPAVTRSGTPYFTIGSKTKETLLPIELVSFTADCDGRSSLIEWTTATEKNNEYFLLERSDDAINFTEITRMPSAAEGGNSIEPLNYSYTDYGVHGGDNYYRLWQVDYDGTRTASEIIVANCVEPEVGEPDVQAYPNPFNGELTLILDNFENRPATIEVYDMLGKLIYMQKADSPQNEYQTVLNLRNLPPAAYTIRVSTNDFVINKNVIKN